MCGPVSCFELRLRIVSSHEPSWKSRFVRCVRGSSRIRSSKTSPTHSRSDLAVAFVLLTTSAALSARAESLASVPIRDQKIVNRWSLPGDPHGLAVGRDGTVYVGVALPQAVMAIDPRRGTVKRKVVLDSAEIASTKELVTVRTDRAGTHLFVANGSDESVTILALPELKILREITIEGEPIRDALPDPKGRYLYLLGRRVHVYDAGGRSELRTLDFDEPMAIAASANGSTLAVIGSQNGSTVVALYNAATFEELARDPLQTDRPIESALS